MLTIVLKAAFIFSILVSVSAQKCSPVNFGEASIVCACNATYCDFYPDPQPPSKGKFIWYVTTKSGERLSQSIGNITSSAKNELKITIDSGKQFQSMLGFGGAFTDAAGINIKKLSKGAQENLLKSYFSNNGSKYNFGRVPIGCTDFSTKPYTYADVEGDVELKHFKLANEDFEYKIPLMKRALELNPSLRFLSASWTAPLWMKNTPVYFGYSLLQEKYYQLYANYIVKFLEEYRKQGLKFWLVSTGNEPFTSLSFKSKVISMYWPSESVAKWMTNNLYPAIANSSSNETNILLYDDQREIVYEYVTDIIDNYNGAMKYVKGVGVHWYKDECTSGVMIDKLQDLIPDKFILMSEACVGDKPWHFPKVALGSWERAELLIRKMFDNFGHSVAGWVDWNMALNRQGGPTWTGNFVDSPIIVDETKDVFYKQPMFYVMAHFSKFVPRSSMRVEANSTDDKILSIAFKTEDNLVVLLYNNYGVKKNVSIVDEKVGIIDVELPEYSLHTILYKNS